MDVLVARQPVLSSDSRVVGYHICYSAYGPTAVAEISAGASALPSGALSVPGLSPYVSGLVSGAVSAMGTGATRDCTSLQAVANAVLSVGFDVMAGARRVFVPYPGDYLCDGAALFPKNRVVIAVRAADALAQRGACEALVAEGYQLAVTVQPGDVPPKVLIDLASVVQIPVRQADGVRAAETVRAVRALGAPGLQCLALDVASPEAQRAAVIAGFQLFHGTFFAVPEPQLGTHVPVPPDIVIELLRRLRQPETTDAQLTAYFARDPQLAVKLIRIANAAGGHGRAHVSSLQHALTLVGRDILARWMSILLVGALRSPRPVSTELIRTALVRARLGELLASAAHLAPMAGPLFLTGLFSTLEALLGRRDVLDTLGLDAAITDALDLGTGPLAFLWQLTVTLERGEWERALVLAEPVGLAPRGLDAICRDSLAWADSQMIAMLQSSSLVDAGERYATTSMMATSPNSSQSPSARVFPRAAIGRPTRAAG